jgi:Resolvase, N terminal domain
MAWSIDRLGRSLIDLLGTIQHLEACGVDLYLDQQSIDTTTPTGRLMFQICGAFAEFERSMIRQRISAGLSRARAQGKRLGRPRVASTVERQVRRQLAKGNGHPQGRKNPRAWDWYSTANQAGNGSGPTGDLRLFWTRRGAPLLRDRHARLVGGIHREHTSEGRTRAMAAQRAEAIKHPGNRRDTSINRPQLRGRHQHDLAAALIM